MRTPEAQKVMTISACHYEQRLHGRGNWVSKQCNGRLAEDKRALLENGKLFIFAKCRI